jgi:hypothetical protein
MTNYADLEIRKELDEKVYGAGGEISAVGR